MRMTFTVLVAAAALLVAAGGSALAQDAPAPPVRVFVAESAAQAFDGSGWGGTAGGSNDQTVEIQKNLQEKRECEGLRVTNRAQRAHFVIAMDRSEGGFSKRAFGFASCDHKIAVFDGWGDLLYSNSTRSLGNAVKDVCEAIQREVAAGAALITVGEADDQ